MTSTTVAALRGVHPVIAPEDELLAAGDIDGLIQLKRSIFGASTMKADDDDTDDDDTDDDDTDDGDDDDEDDDEDEDERDKEIERLKAENKSRRLRQRKKDKELAELKREVARLAKGGKPKASGKDDEDDDSSGKDDEALKELQSDNETLVSANDQLRLQLEFTTDDTVEWASPKAAKAAFKLLDTSDIEMDEDGSIDGLQDAIKELAKEHPYLVKEAASEDDDDDEDEKPKPTRRRKGQPSSSARKSKTPDAAALRKKYKLNPTG